MLHENIMKHTKLLCFAAVSFFAPQMAKAEDVSCERLLSSYHAGDKISYYREVQNFHDASIPRANYREQQKTSFFLEKLVILQLMEKHDCDFPTVVRKNYGDAAYACGDQSPHHPDCDMENWVDNWERLQEKLRESSPE